MEQSKSQVNNDVLYPRVKGDSGCPLNITGGTQNQEAMTEGHRKWGGGAAGYLVLRTGGSGHGEQGLGAGAVSHGNESRLRFIRRGSC